MKHYIFLFLLYVLAALPSANGQQWSVYSMTGFNLSGVYGGGDPYSDVNGNKFGLAAGLGVDRYWDGNKAISMELTYLDKGRMRVFQNGSIRSDFGYLSFHLNFSAKPFKEIPLYAGAGVWGAYLLTQQVRRVPFPSQPFSSAIDILARTDVGVSLLLDYPLYSRNRFTLKLSQRALLGLLDTNRYRKLEAGSPFPNADVNWVFKHFSLATFLQCHYSLQPSAAAIKRF